MNPLGFPVLSVIVFLPLLGALVLALFFRSENEEAMKGWALAVTVVDFLFSILLLMGWQSTNEMQYVENLPWVPRLGISYLMGVDGISIFFVLLATFLMPVVLFAGWNAIKDQLRGFLFFMLVLETGVIGVFMSLDLVLFFVFWEAMLVPMYFLIGVWGGERRRYATTKFFIYTMAGSALMLVGILFLASESFRAGTGFTFNLTSLYSLKLDPQTQIWLFAAFGLAFAVKVPIFPFHTWLPDAYYEAPFPVTAFMAALLSKMGIYGFLRLCLPLFPAAVPVFAPIISILAIVGIIYGSLVALGQKDAKYLVAYSSLAHLSLIVLGHLCPESADDAGGSRPGDQSRAEYRHPLSSARDAVSTTWNVHHGRHGRAVEAYAGLRRLPADRHAGGRRPARAERICRRIRHPDRRLQGEQHLCGVCDCRASSWAPGICLTSSDKRCKVSYPWLRRRSRERTCPAGGT